MVQMLVGGSAQWGPADSAWWWRMSSTGADATISVGDNDTSDQIVSVYTWFGLNRPRQGAPEQPDGQGQERQRQGQVLQDRAQPWELPASG